MKNKQIWTAGYGFLAACLMLTCLSATAQNLLKNGSFEDPIDPPGAAGTNNWVTVFAKGTAAEFLYADRTTEACKSTDATYPGGSFGAGFGTRHWYHAHAYHKQIVTGLTPGASYTLKGYLHHGFDNNHVNGYVAFIGGPAGTTIVSNRATLTRPPSPLSWTNTATTNGTIEVRVGLNQTEFSVVDAGQAKWYSGTAWFDVFSLTPTP